MLTLEYALERLDRLQPRGNGRTARCPAHDDHRPSLSIGLGKDGRTVLLRCWSRGCSYSDIVAAIGGKPPDFLANPGVKTPTIPAQQDYSESAKRIWQQARATTGTPVEVYLRLRGLTILPPASLRFHPSLKHPSGVYLPAMVAGVRDPQGRLVAVHRTFLEPRGTRKADVDPNKMTLGACRGGAVRLAEAGPLLAICEGVETGLSVLEATGYPIWATLGTSGLRSVKIPDTVCDLIIAADGDEAGRKAASAAAQMFQRAWRQVRIAHPPEGTDFNDMRRLNV